MAMSLLAVACGAAVDVSSGVPGTLRLFDEVVVTTVDSSVTVSTESSDTTPTTAPALAGSNASSSSAVVGSPTTPTTLTTLTTESTTSVDPNAAFCRAAIAIDDLGTFVSLDDAEAATVFFNTQVERWQAAAAAAPQAIASDVRTVASFQGEVRTLLADNGFDLFAVFEELTALEVSSGSDVARIRTDQFIFANCNVSPPQPEQATAAFYGQLLGSAADRTYLAELLASAEVLLLDGARCFVESASPDVMHPLVGAPATPAQDAALASILSACRISIGT